MELLFIRHGQPAWVVDGVARPDAPLTEVGHTQARLAAHRLAGDPRGFSEIIVSPAVRSQQTAAPIAEALGLTPTTIDDIVEIGVPDWTGQPAEVVADVFATAQHRSIDEWWDGLPGGESFRDFHNRIVGAFLRFLQERGTAPSAAGDQLWHDDGDHRRIVIVAHGGTNAVALAFLLGLDPTPWEWERFILYHASFARLRAIPMAGDDVWSLRTFNDREHLPEDLRTR
ncbi:MAG TPA: histidine phosphatase family protein [Acidimicrobiia bacterium]|nr:histidine phosphatase family protein [Acidimicrobiia bacterium]